MDADVYLYIFVTEKYFIDILKYNENIYLFPLYLCIILKTAVFTSVFKFPLSPAALLS